MKATTKNSARPTCPACRYHRYSVETPEHYDRPRFTCLKCGLHWTNGLRGKPYAAFAEKKEAP